MDCTCPTQQNHDVIMKNYSIIGLVPFVALTRSAALNYPLYNTRRSHQPPHLYGTMKSIEDPRIVNYPIPGNEGGGVLHIYGKPNARNVILYCGGFPDDHQPFTPLARLLATSEDGIDSEDDCFVGITCFPGFDYSIFGRTKFQGFRRKGYSFEEVAICIREATNRLFLEYDNAHEEDNKGTRMDDSSASIENEIKKPQFTCIFHDWGVVPGLTFVNRAIEQEFTQHTPDRIVLLDVLTWPHPNYKDLPSQNEVSYPLQPSNRDLLFSFSYRAALASGFFMLRYISELFGLITAGILYGIVFLLKLNPTLDIDNRLVGARDFNPFHLVYMFYPYFYMFQNIFTKSGLDYASVPLDLVKTPILYIYGPEKNVMFHDWKSLALLERDEKEGRSESRVVRIEGTGHWMYVQRPDICLQEIKKFLKGSDRHGDEVET